MLECHLVSGDFDYLIKARIGEMADYRKLLGDILLQLPGAVQSKSYVVMEEIKETLTIAVDVLEIKTGLTNGVKHCIFIQYVLSRFLCLFLPCALP